MTRQCPHFSRKNREKWGTLISAVRKAAHQKLLPDFKIHPGGGWMANIDYFFRLGSSSGLM